MRDFHYSLLRSHGFVLGPRDPNRNKDFEGKFMVAEPMDDGWCIVGDDYET